MPTPYPLLGAVPTYNMPRAYDAAPRASVPTLSLADFARYRSYRLKQAIGRVPSISRFAELRDAIMSRVLTVCFRGVAVPYDSVSCEPLRMHRRGAFRAAHGATVPLLLKHGREQPDPIGAARLIDTPLALEYVAAVPVFHEPSLAVAKKIRDGEFAEVSIGIDSSRSRPAYQDADFTEYAATVPTELSVVAAGAFQTSICGVEVVRW